MTYLFDSWPPETFEIIGVVGFLLYVLNYTLLTLGKFNSKDVGYFVFNWIAASMVLIGLIESFNLASALIQIFWIVISTVGIALRVYKRTQNVPVFAHSQPIDEITAPPQPVEPSPTAPRWQDVFQEKGSQGPEFVQRKARLATDQSPRAL